MSAATATILSNGQQIPPQWALLSLAVERELNRLPTAFLEFADETQLDASGPVKKSPFGISGTDTFLPGTAIEIKLRYEDRASDEATVFKGVVIRHGIEADASGCRLTVQMKDSAVTMTGPRKWRVFSNSTDSQVLLKLAQEASLAADIDATTYQHPALVQYDCTDWDFAVVRAEANGRVLTATDGKLACKPIAFDGAVKYTFDLDLGDLGELEMELNVGDQLSGVQGFGWDPAQQAVIGPATGANFPLKQGNVQGDKAADSVGFGGGTLWHPVPMTLDELQPWADGRLARNRLAFVRGRFSSTGLGDLALLDLIELKNVGGRFDGQTLVTGLRHSLGSEGWRTDIQFGLSPRRISQQEGFREPPAAGLLPAAGGLQIGTVRKIDADPANQFRVQVQLATMDTESAVVWARWASPQAAAGSGCFFLPDVGDEVVVGFLDGDPRHPVIIGALFSSKNAPPAPYNGIDEKNLYKGFVTSKGLKLAFVDSEKPSVSVETPGGNKWVLDDDAESITLTDQYQNTITMSQAGIALKSTKDLTFEANGNVTIKGVKVDVQ